MKLTLKNEILKETVFCIYRDKKIVEFTILIFNLLYNGCLDNLNSMRTDHNKKNPIIGKKDTKTKEWICISTNFNFYKSNKSSLILTTEIHEFTELHFINQHKIKG